MRLLGLRTLTVVAGATAIVGASIAGGCSDSGGTGGATGTTTGASPTTTSAGGATSASTTASNSASSTSTGMTPACTQTAKGTGLRGSAIAVTSDDKFIVSANRDKGSVTVMSVDYSDTFPKMTVLKELDLGAGSEPWQVVIDACDATAYVVLRKDQKVVEITGLNMGMPAIGKSVAVGSEPTSLALTPNNTKLYVSNWVDGTLSIVDPLDMKVTATVDLNATIAATNLLGPNLTARPALAHPRGIAITNNGDSKDDDEQVLVTEWFAVRTGPEDSTATNSDHNWKGLLYKLDVMTNTPSTIDLPPVTDTKFNDAKGQATGCFPNQVASVTVDNGFAYVSSTCASPVGPVGVFQKGACQVDANCAGALAGSCVNGSCKGSCTLDSDCGVGSAAGACDLINGGVCKPLTANAKTTTHPAVTIVDLATGVPATTNLDALFTNTAETTSGTASTRMPLLPTDIDFRPGFAYVASEGADALFRLSITNGAITKVGSSNNNFIDVHTPVATGQGLHLPIGVAISKNKGFAFVNDEGTYDVTAIDLNAQAVAVSAGGTDFRVTSATPLPAAGTPEASILAGKRFFTTGLGRWSLQGAAWGSCAACHVDGLSDNVTWYFARGPRQTISLDGTFSKGANPTQRILNWTGIADEIADFEANVRGVSGGIGALVTVANATCTVATQTTDCPNSQVCNAITLKCNPDPKDRINQLTQTPQQIGLQGSNQEMANPAGTGPHPHSAIDDWLQITAYIKAIRSPRAPTNLAAADVAAGQQTFSDPAKGNCIGCHSGAQWTISRVFYTPDDTLNDIFTSNAPTSLSGTTWNKPVPGFPVALFPSTTAGKQNMRNGAPPGLEQLECILRPVGTIVANGAVPKGVSDPAVNVLELRQDMVTGAQGAGGTNANDVTFGFNPPSLLGLSVGAPYFHAGNARTLEEAFSSQFLKHHQSAVAQVFSPTATDVKQLVAFLLSIDTSTAPIAIPAAGATGGDICVHP